MTPPPTGHPSSAEGEGNPGPEGWFEVLDSDVVYQGYSTVRQDVVAMPDGSTRTREVVDHMDAVAVVPVLDDGSVLLLRQYRHPHGRYLLEIPAGKLDQEGEDPAEAADRELREEVGYTAARLEPLVRFDNSAGWNTERTTVYLGRELVEAPPPEDFESHAEEADMEVVRIPFSEAVAEARRGRLTDAKTLIGLLLAAGRVEG